MVAGVPGGKRGGQGSAGQTHDTGTGRAKTIHLHNRYSVRGVRLGLLRRITQALLEKTWPDGGFDLAVCLVAAPEMTRLNEAFLRHKGSTDVITFDYSERVGQALLHGEIVICVDEAVRQARRFHTTWQSELVRYVVHGVLHLLGYDDQNSRARQRMKATEDALVRRLGGQFAFGDLRQTRSRCLTRV